MVLSVDAPLRTSHIEAYDALEAYALARQDRSTNKWEDRRLCKYFPSTKDRHWEATIGATQFDTLMMAWLDVPLCHGSDSQ